MKISYSNLNIPFRLEDTHFQALNIIYERFYRSIPSHSHGSDSFEIHYISEGYGKAKINDTYYDLKPNTLFITGPHIEHSQIPAIENPMCEYCVYVKIKPSRRNHSQTSEDSVANLFQQYPFWIGADTQNIHAIMKHLFFELDNKILGYKENVQALLCQLVIGTVRNCKDIRKSNLHFATSDLIDTKPLLIEEYFLYEYNDLTLDNLAKRLGLSTRQTERYIKEYYGKTFIQKRTESKMSTAALLLSDTSRSVSSIADELGYASVEHFSTAFKRYYNVSPSNYRKDQLQ